MDVLFISDYSLDHNKGGAQQSNEQLIRYGREIGHNIKLHAFDSSIVDFLHNYDLLISSNLPLNLKLKPYLFEKIISHPNHVRVEHDMNSYLDNQSRKILFQSAKKVFFLSQYHLDQFNLEYGDYFKNSEIVYDPIDPCIFYNKNQTRNDAVVYAGFFHPLKGVFNLIEFAKKNPEQLIELYGFFENGLNQDIFQNYKNIKFNGLISHLELADVFNANKYIYHNPEVKEPFCRMVAEALMCGMQPICNDKIGSLKEFEKVGLNEFVNKCKNAPQIFWDKIKSL